MTTSSKKTRPPKERDIILIPLESQQEILNLFRLYQKEKSDLKKCLDSKSAPHVYLTKEIRDTEAEIRHFPRRKDAHLYLATLYEMNGDLADAIKTLEKLVSASPNSPDAYVQLISLYERQGDYDTAYDYYNRMGKPRVAICLREFSEGGYNEFLVCGITGQANDYYYDDLDEIVDPDDSKDRDLNEHITRKSVIRLGFLSRIRKEHIPQEVVLGEITEERHERLLKRLAKYITSSYV